MRLALLASLFTAWVIGQSTPPAVKTPSAAPDRQAMYEAEIKPLLERSCAGCHSVTAKKRRGGFHADSIAALVKGGKENGPGITWGKPMESAVYLLAQANRDDDLAMPPKKSKSQPLTPAELATLRRWIETSR